MNQLVPNAFSDAANVEAEQAVLGAIVMNNETMEQIAEIGFDST